MKTHHTKTLGDLGVLKATSDLCQKGFLVCIPMSEHAPFDLVVYKNSKFLRVQVKSRRIDKNGGFTVAFRSCYSTSKGVQTIPVDKSNVDLYCIYCINNDTCYYFNPNEFSVTVSFRVRMPKNNQLVKVRFANDFREVP